MQRQGEVQTRRARSNRLWRAPKERQRENDSSIVIATPYSSAPPAPTLSAAGARSGAEETVCPVAVCAVSKALGALRWVITAPAGGGLKGVEMAELTVGWETSEDSVWMAFAAVYKAMRAG